jgi:hypothetical protein
VATGVAAEIPGQGMHDRAAHRYLGACDYRVKVRSLGVDYLPAGEPAYSPWVRVGGVSKLADLTPMLFRLDASDDGTLALGTAAQFTRAALQCLHAASPTPAVLPTGGDFYVAGWMFFDPFLPDTNLMLAHVYGPGSVTSSNFAVFRGRISAAFELSIQNPDNTATVLSSAAQGAPAV